MGLNPIYLTGANRGLTTNAKPMLIPDKAWQKLENAYVWRERVVRRKGLSLLGRLARTFTSVNFFLSGTSPWTFNLLEIVGYVSAANNANPGQITTTEPHGLSTSDKVIITGILGATGYNDVTFTITKVDDLNFTVGADATGFGSYMSGGFFISDRSLSSIQPYAELDPGSITVVIGTGGGAITFTDNGDGTLSSVTPGNSGYVNYNTGSVTLTTTASDGTSTIVSFGYYPTLPVMGAPLRETPALNDEQTIFFDQTYAYMYTGTTFNEFIAGTTWTGSNSQFFWGFNYRGNLPQNVILFVTNFNIDDPMFWTDGMTWNEFQPLVTSTNTMFQARILIAYYGRLLALNVWEGVTSDGPESAVNITNRCRFSAANASPLASNSWRVDIFGQGGVIDAPTSEAITGATFIKNTLVVDFESTTWQLRYVGEYGLPFIWERVSADFGSNSTFSGVLFDNFRLSIGDTAITAANSIGVDRIDLEIPDQIFSVQNINDGPLRVFGIRDYIDELVYWNFPDSTTMADDDTATIFPNYVFVYNYRNKTFSYFRDNVTCFSTIQELAGVTWDSTEVTWDSEEETWDDPQDQIGSSLIVSGNQQGFVHYYNDTNPDDPSLTVYSISLTDSPIQIVSPNHNLQSGEIIQLNGLLFLDSSTFMPLTSSLNGRLFQVSVVDFNTLSLSYWDFAEQDYSDVVASDITPVSSALYMGGGTITLFPLLDIQSKDFNIYADKGFQIKLSSINFLMETTASSAMTVNVFMNSSPSAIRSNIALWSTHVNTNPATGFNPDNPQYAWFPFYATASGQYFNIELTYDDNLRNTLATYQQGWTLYGINAMTRRGGRMVI